MIYRSAGRKRTDCVVSCSVLAALLLLLGGIAWSSPPEKTIVLIGGPKSHGAGEHDFPAGISLIKQFIEESPDARGMRVLAYPNGWPEDASALDGASSVVLYFDGLQGGETSHPLLDAAHRAQFESLMKAGGGVVALHQASTVPVNDTTINLERWLGGARHGMFDRAMEPVLFVPPNHPISRGVGNFLLDDEFYPTIRFAGERGTVTAILTGLLHPQFRNGSSLVIDKGEAHPVAWAYQRDDGGRAFSFTGLHYLVGLDNPALRKLLLNAIFWTANVNVPLRGVGTAAPRDAAEKVVALERERVNGPARTVREAIVMRPEDAKVVEYPWGHLVWYVSGELRNSDTMTVGEAVIRPGQHNPRHVHPNCDEVLHVVTGHIRHTMGDETVEMQAGDTVSIPAGIFHNATNIGPDNAVLSISFSSPDRQVVGE